MDQILTGLYPISQTREPYSAIRYLAERIPLEEIYCLIPPSIPANTLLSLKNQQEAVKIFLSVTEKRIC